MFAFLARFTGKYRIPIIVVWLAAAVALFLVAPTLSEVGVTDESQFLPQDTESAEAAQLLADKFPAATDVPATTGLIVFHDQQGLGEADMAQARTVRDWLISDSGPEAVENVTSVFDAEALKARLVSADGTTMLMPVDFSSPALSDEAGQAVTQIRDYLAANHTGGSVYVTGEVGFFQDLLTSVQQTIDRTTVVTVILVAILLLIIYRSPVAVLLPLLAIGCSFAVARGILGFIGAAGMDISTLADAYLVVIVFGIGTDYCLFIVSRFREELRQRGREEARALTMRRIGPVIAASALTVIVGFLSLAISRFGMTKTTGYALAIGVAITVVAGLTLVPALMSLLGRQLFWPIRTGGAPKQGRFGWANVGEWVSRHPVAVVVPIVVVLLVPYAALPHLESSADIINQMPKNAPSVQGYRVMSEHFPMGETSPLYLLIESSGDISGPDSLGAIQGVAASLASVDGVARVDYHSAPADEISGMATQVRDIVDGITAGGGLEGLSALSATGDFLQGLAVQYPAIVQSPNFQQAAANLAEVSATAGSLTGAGPEMMPLLIHLRDVAYGLADNLDGLSAEFNLQADTPFTSYLRSTYFSADGTTARINIVLDSEPYSSATTSTVVRVRDAASGSIAASGLSGSTHYVGGESATRADILLTNDADFGRVTAVAIAGILIIIIILLRSLLAPLYMVLTVLLNYGATLGIATWVFLDVMDQSSMIYMLPIFIFVVLVALGADYNIFLVSRIREEAHTAPTREAVKQAVTHTGGVITSCGIILAGTFATLTTTPLQVVLQIGAAIAIGVVLDTFVVRALLVPALASLAGRWSWWPSGQFRAGKARGRQDVTEPAAE